MLLITFGFLQQIPNKPTTRFFEKAPLRGAFSKNLGLVCSQSAVIALIKSTKVDDSMDVEFYR